MPQTFIKLSNKLYNPHIALYDKKRYYLKPLLGRIIIALIASISASAENAKFIGNNPSIPLLALVYNGFIYLSSIFFTINFYAGKYFLLKIHFDIKA